MSVRKPKSVYLTRKYIIMAIYDVNGLKCEAPCRQAVIPLEDSLSTKLLEN